MGDFNWSSLFGAVGGIGDMIYNIFRDQSLTGAQREQNAWNSSEAQKARDFSAGQAQLTRDFNSAEALAQREWSSSEAFAQREWSSQEAERARDWQEEMYAKYNSLSGKMSQARAAGVNPMLAVTGSAVSPMTTNSPMPSGSSASGSAASASSPAGASAGGSASGGIAGALNLAKLFLGFKDAIASINLKDSEAKKNLSQSGAFDADAQKSLAEALESNARTLKVQEETKWLEPYNTALISKIESETGKLDAEKLTEEMSRQFIEIQKNYVETQHKHAKLQIWFDNIFKVADLVLKGVDIFTWKNVMKNFKANVSDPKRNGGIELDSKSMEIIDTFLGTNTDY